MMGDVSLYVCISVQRYLNAIRDTRTDSSNPAPPLKTRGSLYITKLYYCNLKAPGE